MKVDGILIISACVLVASLGVDGAGHQNLVNAAMIRDKSPSHMVTGKSSTLDPLTVLRNGTQTIKNNLQELLQEIHNGNTTEALSSVVKADHNLWVLVKCMTSILPASNQSH